MRLTIRGVPFTYVPLERRSASWGEETWLGHGIEMSGSHKKVHGIFCTSVSLNESRISSRMLVRGGVLLQPYLVAKALWQFTQMLYSSTS